MMAVCELQSAIIGEQTHRNINKNQLWFPSVHTHAPCLVQRHGPVSEADTVPWCSWEIASMSGPHKGIYSVARMLDLCRVSVLLCAPRHQSDLRSQ